MPDRTVQDLIRDEATKQGVPPELALSVAEQESGFDPTVHNPSGAHGTFQLMPATAKGLGVDPTDPIQNITGGVTYLKQLLDQHQGNLTDALNQYGGDLTKKTYAGQVLARLPKYQTGAAATAKQATSAPVVDPNAPPAPTSLLTKTAGFGMDMLRGLDPRTERGRGNLAGMAGAAALTAVAPELELPALAAKAMSIAVPVAGAYLGGAGENAAEQGVRKVAGAPPTPTSVTEAGRSQASTEAIGQGLMRGIVQPISRRLAASTMSDRISSALDDAITAVKDRVGMTRSAVSPSSAGQMAHQVAYGKEGAAKLVKDQLGEEVETAAKSGPAIPTAPLRDRLNELATQITPMASHEQVAAIPGYSAEQAAAIAKRNPDLGLSTIPDDHPLPAVLDKIRSALTDQDTIPFEDAHKIKRLLDDATNWDSPAKKQVEQVTKGFRQTLRESMSSHQPYNQATEAYGTVAKLYQVKAIKSLRNAVQTNPESLVAKLSWKNPSGATMVRDLIRDVPQEGSSAGAHEGQAAWSAVRSAWAHENLFAKGPAGMSAQIQKMEASANGQEFISTLFDGPDGQAVWQNAKQLSQAFIDAEARAQAFSGSDLAHTTSMAGSVRDFALAVSSGHPIGKVGAVARFALGKGTKVSEMLEWAAHSDARTQFVVKHVLSGPDPGQALAGLMRWFQGSGGEPDKPMASHGGPPMPGTVRTSTGTAGPPRPSSLP